ncbi:hypothetical protein J6590_051188 [Homalodisca vitripennis]|nr:hypothetical protein J6590_051188 [Homalodisca vitripennis]
MEDRFVQTYITKGFKLSVRSPIWTVAEAMLTNQFVRERKRKQDLEEKEDTEVPQTISPNITDSEYDPSQAQAKDGQTSNEEEYVPTPKEELEPPRKKKRVQTSVMFTLLHVFQCLPLLRTVQQHIQTRKNATSHNEATTSIGINSGTDIQDAIPHCSSRHFCERALTSHPRSVVVHDIFECRTEEEARHMAEGILRQRRGPNVSLESRGRGFTLLGFHATNTGEGAFSHVHPVHDCRWAQYTCRCSCFRQLVRRGHTKRKTYKLESLQAKGLRLLAEYVLEYQKSQVLAEVSGQRWAIRCETGNVQMEGRSEFGCCGVVEARTDEFKWFFFSKHIRKPTRK